MTALATAPTAPTAVPDAPCTVCGGYREDHRLTNHEYTPPPADDAPASRIVDGTDAPEPWEITQHAPWCRHHKGTAAEIYYWCYSGDYVIPVEGGSQTVGIRSARYHAVPEEHDIAAGVTETYHEEQVEVTLKGDFPSSVRGTLGLTLEEARLLAAALTAAADSIERGAR